MDTITYSQPHPPTSSDGLRSWGRATVALGLHVGIRVCAGVTQSELAQRIGTTSRTVSAWETGEHRPGHFELPYYAALTTLISSPAA